MKPNDLQKETINSVIITIEHWKYTNDINSPSHWSLIEDTFLNCSEELEIRLNENQGPLDGFKTKHEIITQKLSEILFLIQDI